MPCFSAATMDSITTNEIKFNTKVGGSKLSNHHTLWRESGVNRLSWSPHGTLDTACVPRLSVCCHFEVTCVGGWSLFGSRSKSGLVQQLLEFRQAYFSRLHLCQLHLAKFLLSLQFLWPAYLHSYKLVECVNKVAHACSRGSQALKATKRLLNAVNSSLRAAVTKSYKSGSQCVIFGHRRISQSPWPLGENSRSTNVGSKQVKDILLVWEILPNDRFLKTCTLVQIEHNLYNNIHSCCHCSHSRCIGHCDERGQLMTRGQLQRVQLGKEDGMRIWD